MAPSVPKDLEIVPIYLNVEKDSDGLHFMIAECSFPDPRDKIAAMDELQVKKRCNLIIPSKIMGF